jgi:PKD repeat protein
MSGRWLERRTRRGQHGMTLIETLLAVMLSSLMVLPMLGWASLALREQAATQDRNISSSSLGTLRTYFVRDVTTADWAATEGEQLAECSSGSKGVSTLMVLGHGDARIGYEMVPVDDFTSTLQRVLCLTAGTPPARSTELAGGVISGGTGVRCDTGEDLAAVAKATGLVAPEQRSPAAASAATAASPSESERGCRRITLQLTNAELEQVAMTASLRTGSSTSVDVAEPPVAIASATPTTGPRRLKVQFDGTGSSDPFEERLTYRWDFGDGATATEPTPVHQYRTLGTFTATLEVTNESGLSATTSIEVTVTDNPPTAVIASPAAGTTTFRGEQVKFSPAGSNDDRDKEFGGRIVQHLWDFGDGTGSTEAEPTKAYATLSPKEGFLVRLVVVDDAGQTAEATTRVIVANRLPAVTIVASTTTGPTPLTVDFSSTVVDESTMATNPLLTYAWNFGDGGTSTLADPPPRTYTGAGTRTVTLTVTDDQGATATATQTITVGAELLAAPPNLMMLSSGNSGGARFANMSWGLRTGATLYEVRLTCDGCPDVHTATSTTTSVRVGGLRTARSFYFATVRARNATGEWGPWSTGTVRIRP